MVYIDPPPTQVREKFGLDEHGYPYSAPYYYEPAAPGVAEDGDALPATRPAHRMAVGSHRARSSQGEERMKLQSLPNIDQDSCNAHVRATMMQADAREVLAVLVAAHVVTPRRGTRLPDEAVQGARFALDHWVDVYVQVQEERSAMLIIREVIKRLAALPDDAGVAECRAELLHLANAMRLHIMASTAGAPDVPMFAMHRS